MGIRDCIAEKTEKISYLVDDSGLVGEILNSDVTWEGARKAALLGMVGTFGVGGAVGVTSQDAYAGGNELRNYLGNVIVDEFVRETVREGMRDEGEVIYVPINQEKRIVIREWHDANKDGYANANEIGGEISGFFNNYKAGLHIELIGATSYPTKFEIFEYGQPYTYTSGNGVISFGENFFADGELKVETSDVASRKIIIRNN